MKYDHVVARFNGADLTFKIDRADLDLFERIHRKALASIKAVAAGDWSVADLKLILSFALLSTPQVDRLRKIHETNLDGSEMVWQMLADMQRRQKGEPTERAGLLASPTVEAAFAKNPPAVYAELVIAILTAALLGIEAADAVFTDEAVEEQPDGA